MNAYIEIGVFRTPSKIYDRVLREKNTVLTHHHRIDRSQSTTLLFQYSLSFIAFARSSFCSSMSSSSWSMNFCLCLPRALLPCVSSHNSSWWGSSSLLRQQCPLNLTLWAAIVVVIFGIAPHITSCLMCCFHDTFLILWASSYSSHPASFQVPLWGYTYMSRKVTRLWLLRGRIST